MEVLEIGGTGEANELCPTLSYKQRLIGFLTCIAIGFFLSVLSWVTVFLRNFPLFGIIFTMSSLISIGSSFFLAGPLTQVKKMFAEKRIIATVVFIAAMVLTLVVALVLKSGILTIVCCLVQYLAMTWYALSYIPFARTAVIGCFNRLIGR